MVFVLKPYLMLILTLPLGVAPIHMLSHESCRYLKGKKECVRGLTIFHIPLLTARSHDCRTRKGIPCQRAIVEGFLKGMTFQEDDTVVWLDALPNQLPGFHTEIIAFNIFNLLGHFL